MHVFDKLTFDVVIIRRKKSLFLVSDYGELLSIGLNGWTTTKKSIKIIVEKKELGYVRIRNEISHLCGCMCVRATECESDTKFGRYWKMIMVMLTYVNAWKSKCVFGGRPGNRTIMKNTTRKFRTERYNNLHSPILSLTRSTCPTNLCVRSPWR